MNEIPDFEYKPAPAEPEAVESKESSPGKNRWMKKTLAVGGAVAALGLADMMVGDKEEESIEPPVRGQIEHTNQVNHSVRANPIEVTYSNLTPACKWSDQTIVRLKEMGAGPFNKNDSNSFYEGRLPNIEGIIEDFLFNGTKTFSSDKTANIDDCKYVYNKTLEIINIVKGISELSKTFSQAASRDFLLSELQRQLEILKLRIEGKEAGEDLIRGGIKSLNQVADKTIIKLKEITTLQQANEYLMREFTDNICILGEIQTSYFDANINDEDLDQLINRLNKIQESLNELSFRVDLKSLDERWGYESACDVIQIVLKAAKYYKSIN